MIRQHPKTQNRADSMDIPQQPKPTTSAVLTATNTRTPEITSTPVSIDALRLEKGKIYQAVVNQLIDNKTPSMPVQANETPPSDTEWLLKLNGKLLRISSEKPLQLGQTLLVKLDTTSQTLTVLNPTRPQVTESIKPNSPLTSHAAITSLLNAINQVMPRQVSLEAGLSALTLFSKQSESQQVSKQAELILLLLSKQAPTQQLFSGIEKKQMGPLSTHLLKDSGVFFESNTKQHPNNTSNLKLQISQIHQALNLKQHFNGDNRLQTPAITQSTNDTPSTNLETTKSNTTNTLNTTRTALLARLQTTLNPPSSSNLAEQTAQHTKLNSQPTNGATQHNPLNTHLNSTPLNTLLNNIPSPLNLPKSSTEHSSIHNDLKGLLLSITAALKVDNSDAKLTNRPHIEALAQLDLLKDPFNFPHLTHQLTSLTSPKTESLLADQQFTTGQLLKLIAGMLNRIQFNQLNSLYQSHSNSNETSTIQSWFFELPVAHPNNQFTTFDVRIDQEEETQTTEQDETTEDKEIQWKLALSFKFEQLGAIYVQVALAPPTISSTIWANNPETLVLIKREKPHFQSKLAELGLEVGDISCQSGQPKHDKTRLDRSLVDLKA